jgi:hypothetical protein
MNAPVTIIGNKSALNHSIHDVLISGAGHLRASFIFTVS